MRPNSVLGERKYSRLTGTFSKRATARTRVPAGADAGSIGPALSACARTRAPVARPGGRDTISRRETAAIEASPSPRNPSVAMDSRSADAVSLLVACRRTASASSSGEMPAPSSATSIASRPPRSISTMTRVAPASTAFSTSSLTMDAGLSMISPAAIWPIVTASSSRMMGTRDGSRRPDERPGRVFSGLTKGKAGVS